MVADMEPTCVICQTPLIQAKFESYKQFIKRKTCKSKECLHQIYSKSARTKGDRYISKDGYVMIMTEKGRQAEHRVVMEEKLNRPLKKFESVHHINGIRDDNNPENLELWLGGIRYGQRARDICCPHCGKNYTSL